MTLPDQNAKFIWTDPHGEGRNRWAMFRTTFDLPAEPAEGELNIFADTRYRLLINGEVVCHGPARFFVVKPEYDTVDVTPFLRPGRNVIAVVVNSQGVNTFHNEASVGGLIAWGAFEDVEGNTRQVATDESWKALESPACRRETPMLSFALNHGELLVAPDLPEGSWVSEDYDDGDWPAAAVHANADHWGELVPRSIPLLDEREVYPRRIGGVWAARQADEDWHSLIVTTPAGGQWHRQEARVSVMTWIRSPRRQEVTFGAWWGRYFLNGTELKPADPKAGPLRQDFTATFEEGWNLLEVHESLRHGWWDFYLALPRPAELEVSADKQAHSPNAFLVGGPWLVAETPAAGELDLPLGDPDALPERLGPWTPWPRERSAQSPCRERAWRRFEPLAGACTVETDLAPFAAKVGDDTLAILYDFGGEVLGRAMLDFEAAEGTVVDVTYCEQLDTDGTADIHGRYFVDMADRCITRGGLQRWQAFHPRGFRYMEVLVRGDLSQFRLHRVAASRANYPVQAIGEFACSDPTLNQVWKLGQAALHACMEDAYLDCPWRERGLYSGDFLAEYHANLAAYGDTALFRRCIELFLLGQGDNGLIRPGAHSLEPGRHPDYTAIIPQTLMAYWTATGDVAFLREAAPRIKKLLAGLGKLREDGGVLVDGRNLAPYVDLSSVDKRGVHCALNCFCQRGFAAAANVFALVGDVEAAGAAEADATELAEAIRQAFWDDEVGAFVDRRREEVPDTGPSVAGNALALLYGIATDDQADSAAEWLAEAMDNNFRVPEPKENSDCNVTSYFSFYALGALYGQGMDVEAEAFMRRYWGHMLDRGAWTTWEYFVDKRGASLCHAWSAAPTYYLSTMVLGVRFPEPGNPDKVVLAPQPGTLQWAEGVFPHPRGGIYVQWQRLGDRLVIAYQAPDGIEVNLPEEV